MAGKGLLAVVLLLQCLLAATAAADGPREIGIIYQGNAPPEEALQGLLDQYGSEVTGFVLRPEGGGYLVSVTRPTDGEQADALMSALGQGSGVTHVESNTCFEFYPDNITPENERSLTSETPPGPELLGSGQEPDWSPDVLQETSSEDGGREFHSTTRAEQQSSQTRRTVGWSMVHDPPTTPPSTPPETPITPDYDNPACEDPTTGTGIGPEIKLSLVSGSPGEFQYPRPIPLQVLARDFDMIQFGCSGCGGEPTNERLFIEDGIALYDWQLTGKGSLNFPFKDLEDDLQAKIDELKKKIAEKSAELEKLKAEKAALEASREERRAELEADIQQLEQQKAEVEAKLAELEPKISEKQARLDEVTAKLEEARAKIDESQGKIDELNEKIKELQDKIDGEPSAESQQIAARLEELERRIEQKQADLERLKTDNVGREQSLAQAYDQAISNLVSARQSLASARSQVVGVQDRIVALENRLYSNPAILDAMIRRGNLARLGMNLQNGYLGGGLPPTLELTNLAQQVFQAPNPSLREAALDNFRQERDRLLSNLQSQCGASGASASECQALLSELQGEVEGLDQVLSDSLTNPTAGGTPQEWQQLEDLRAELAALENSIRAAEQRVAAAEQGVSQAEAAYLDGLQQMLREEADMAGEIEDLQSEAQQVSGELAQARARDEEERLKNTPDWLRQIAELRTQIEELEGDLAAKRLEAELAQVEKDKLSDELRILKNEKKELEGRRDYLQMQIERKRQQLSDLENETDDLDGKIADLEAEIEALKAELIQLQAGVSASAFGNTHASGQQVFYIPPPLEMTDGFNTARFEELKAQLAEKEGAYEQAKAAKVQLQDDAYKILKGFTEQLWAVKAAKKTLEDLDGEISELESEKAKQQVDVAQERNADVAAEQERKAALESEKTGQQGTVDETKRVEEQDKTRVENEEGELQAAERARSDAEQQAGSRLTERDAADQRRRATHRQQSDLMARFRRTVNELQEAEAKLTRAQSALSRATAGEDAGASGSARAEVDRLKGQIDQLNADIDAQRGPLLELDRAYAGRVQDLEQAQKALDDAEEDLREKKDKFWEEVTDVTNAQNSLKQSMEERLSAEREVRKTEDEIKRQDEKISQTQEESDKAVEEDEGVKATQKSLDKKNADKEEAEKEKNKALNKLASLKQKKEEWDARKDTAEADLVKARDELVTARDTLKTFLQNELRQVQLSVTIDLTVADAVVDEFRTQDQPRTVPVTISYEKRRPPNVKGPDDDLEPPSGVPANQSICNVTVEWVPEPQPNIQVSPKPERDKAVGEEGLEPKTIALYYKKGAPLYDLWPPVPAEGGSGGGDESGSAESTADEVIAEAEAAAADVADNAAGGGDSEDGGEEDDVGGKVLVNAATPFVTNASDTDQIYSQCTVGGGDLILIGEQGDGGTGQMCMAGGESGGEVVDVAHIRWDTDTYTDQAEIRTMIRVPEVKPDECEGETDFQVDYLDSLQQWPDTDNKKHKYSRLSGVKGDAPEKYGDFGKGKSVELRFQVFEGGQRGKSGQTVEWKVGGIQPALDASKYGLGADMKKELIGPDALKTDGSGYSKVQFFMDERWGVASVTAEWKREDQVCATATMEIVRPLQLRKIKIGFAPKNGWEQGKKAWEGNSDYEALAAALEGDGPETASSIAVGLLDDWMDPVDEKNILFSVLQPPEAGIDPAEMKTEIYGLAWSFATDVPEEAALQLKAEVEAELAPVTTPSSVEGEQSTATENRFYIGPEGKRFTIETDEPYVPGEAWSGGAKLVIEADVADIPLEFKTLELQAEGIVVEDDGTLVATEGSVTWSVTGAGGKPLSFTVPTFSFQFTLETLGLSAGSDAKLTGKVKVPEKEQEVEFEAILGPKGFLGRVSNFPELEFASVKLEQGAAIVVDMHSEEDPDDLDLKGNWRGKGLVIVQASLVLPESMKGEQETPPKISVKNLFFNSTGLNGTLDVQYTVAARLGKVEFSIEKVLVEFQANQLHKGEFEGKMALADPFHGNMGATASLDRAGKYSFVITTDKPVTAPSLGLAFTLRKVAGEYDQTTKIFTFELEALMRSDTFSDIDVNRFKVTSNGDIEADVAVNGDIQIGKGFDAHLGSFKLKKTETEFAMSLEDAGFKFNEMLKAENASIAIAKGPVIESFNIKIDGNKDPVTFSTEIKYEANTFQGSLKLEVKKLMEVNGTFILGTQKKEDESEFTYWYVELNSKVAIPLGQTGLNIIQLGGGVGYNYDPPIGQAPGAVRNTDTFSLKAAIAVGNVPRGEVFAGRLTMVLVSGRFSVNGLVWLLDKETSLFGEGQLDMYWQDPARMEGFVRMLIALPGSEGKLLHFSGQVDFKFAGSSDWFVKSRTLEGALLEKVFAEGNIDVKPGSALLEGNVRYDLDKSVPLAVVTLAVQVHLRADGKLEFVVTSAQTSLDARLAFRGDMDVTLETKVRNFDLASAVINAELTLNANNQSITVSGSANVSWDTWVHSGSAEVDIGYSSR